MIKPTYDFGTYVFASNDDETGRSWIMLEPSGKSLDAIGDGTLFLNLRSGVDIRQAEELARQLNEMVDRVQHVRFDGLAR